MELSEDSRREGRAGSGGIGELMAAMEGLSKEGTRGKGGSREVEVSTRIASNQVIVLE